MASRYENVIVFGPTGAVGSAAALEASKRGATVWLAMRDTNKFIDGIPSGDNDTFRRVQADLTKPDSVREAIQKSGAKAAFVYLALVPTGMKPTLEAMKDAGVEYIVFLSSYSIEKGVDPRDVAPDAAIPYIHAQAEIALEDLGIAHTALRPGTFATNPVKMAMDTTKTPAELYTFASGKRMVDNIVPKDIGRVGGAVLVDRPSTSSKETIYLFGPDFRTELETSNMIAEKWSKDIKVVQLTSEEWAARMKSKNVPPPLITYMQRVSEGIEARTDEHTISKDDLGNVQRYSGYASTNLEDFIKSLED